MQRLFYSSGRRVRIVDNGSFPYADHIPAHVLETPLVPAVPLPIGFDLADPVIRIGSLSEGFLSSRPVPSVPEIAIAKHCQLLAWEDDIGTPGQVTTMQTIPEAQSP